MFKLPSLQSFSTESISAIKRFPLSLLSSVIASAIAIYLMHSDYEKLNYVNYLWKVIMCCYLGLNLFLATELYSESKGQSGFKRLLIQVLALTLIVCYYFVLPDFKDFGLEDTARFVLFVVGLHLLVSFAPFINVRHTNAFWQYNKSLFIRFLTSGLYTGVLYLGLALALLAIDKLFKVEINSKYYADLWWFLAGIFNTWFFLAGVPKQTQALEGIIDYPKGLKVFTQFVLLPLVTIYLFILYAYGAKIAIAMELPRGWVSYLVIGFSIAGILSLLLIWPIKDREENSWIKIVDRWFYIALYPLIILLGLAVFKRVSQYGITENRYFILVIALWLLIVASYFLLSKNKNIKVIPVSLCIIAFLSSFGPWGAFSVSERSQIRRLGKLIAAEKILIDSRIKKASPVLKGERAEKISSIISYLDKTHGFNGIKPWFSQDLDSIFVSKDTTGSNYINKNEIVLELMGVENYVSYSREGGRDFYIHSHYDQTTINVKGFDYYNEFNVYNSANSSNYKTPVAFDNDTLFVEFVNNKLKLLNDDKETNNVDLVDFVRILKKNNAESYGNYTIDSKQLLYPFETDSLSIQFNFTVISGVIDENDSININNIAAKILIKRK
ncbi:MAG: DUF4153 domain-containing protein [Bacteroidetes bacterium]|nr:DUF4153 domain-containing protein [Bacteroidota bacterium]